MSVYTAGPTCARVCIISCSTRFPDFNQLGFRYSLTKLKVTDLYGHCGICNKLHKLYFGLISYEGWSGGHQFIGYSSSILAPIYSAWRRWRDEIWNLKYHLWRIRPYTQSRRKNPPYPRPLWGPGGGASLSPPPSPGSIQLSSAGTAIHSMWAIRPPWIGLLHAVRYI